MTANRDQAKGLSAPKGSGTITNVQISPTNTLCSAKLTRFDCSRIALKFLPLS